METVESNHVPVQRKKGLGPREAEKKELTSAFQELPEELRLKIWKLTLPGPRLVEISKSNAGPHLDSHRSTPSILHVCSESRKEALRWYTVVRFPLPSYPSMTVVRSRAVYVNFQIDTIYFDVNDFFWTLAEMSWCEAENGLQIKRLMNNLRSMAIRSSALHEDSNFRGPRPLVYRFDKLEKVSVVAVDVGTGEITDKHKLYVWEEWQIGSEINVGMNWEEKICIMRWAYILMLKTQGMKNGDVLKNMKVRIVAVDREHKTDFNPAEASSTLPISSNG